MPLARIITRAVEESQELAAELRGRGYEVEIIPPSEIQRVRADIEIQVEECTPEEALIRAGVLPDRNDMSVFISPGAIAGRRSLATANSSPPMSERRVQKWFEASSPESTLTDEQFQTELGSLESSAFAVNLTSENSGSSDAVDSEPAPVRSDLISSFSAELASAPAVPVNGARLKQDPSVLKPTHRKPGVTQASLASRAHVVNEIDEVLGYPVALIRKPSNRLRIRVPALDGIKINTWKSRVFVVGLAVVVIAMAAWVLRRAPTPAQLGVTPAAAAAPIEPPPVQQAIVPTPKVKARAMRQQPSKPAPGQSGSKVSASKQVDGIKRYSDLD